ncbi:hypothetical protein [uncultured Nostoc sp.]
MHLFWERLLSLHSKAKAIAVQHSSRLLFAAIPAQLGKASWL